MADKKEVRLFNYLFVTMGTLLLGVAGWIGLSVAHIPTIEQRLEDFMFSADKTLGDHEVRIRDLEHKKK